MRRLNWLLAICVSVLLIGCGDDDDPQAGGLPFNMEREAEVIEGYSTKQSIYSGNGEYTLKMRDESIATATYERSFGGVDYGAIILTGRKQGSTVLTVTDVKAQKSIDINVKVISPNFYMLTPVTSNHKALTATVVQCYIPGDQSERDVLFFKSDGIGLKYLTRGKYHTECSDGGQQFLVLSYPMTPNDSTLATSGNVTASEHKFRLHNASHALMTILNATAPIPENEQPGAAAIEMTEEGTTRMLKGNIMYGPQYSLIIPYGYLP